MSFHRKMTIGMCLMALLLATAECKRTTTKTKLDIRVVRSPQHPTEPDAHTAYVVASQHQQAKEDEAAPNHVSVISEAQYEALLKQAQKALQGYDLTKLSAAAHQTVNTASHSVHPPVVHTTAVPIVQYKVPKAMYHQEPAKVYQDSPKIVYSQAPKIVYSEAPKIVYKPSVKYVYSDAATSVAYNTAPVATTYGASYTQTHDEHEPEYDHYSKHKFGYRVHDPHTGAAFGHSEVSEGHVTRGHYHVLLPDGRLQNVKYVADPSGYHATVTYDTYKH